MRLRRLNGRFIVVLTGVENAGKTTLGEALAHHLEWPLIEEAARTDAAMVDGRTKWDDLRRLQHQFIQQLSDIARSTPAPGIICDTGGLVLDIWAQTVFGQGLEATDEALSMASLHLLVHTLPEWEPDPLRTLPALEDRLELQGQYRTRLGSNGCTFGEVEVGPLSKRRDQAAGCIAQHFNA